MKVYSISVILAITDTEEAKEVDSFIRAIITQSIGFKEIELIITHRKVKCETLQLCESYSKRYPDNIIISYTKSNTIMESWNQVAEVARGKYLYYGDCNYILSNEFFDVSVRYFEEINNNSDIVKIEELIYGDILTNNEAKKNSNGTCISIWEEYRVNKGALPLFIFRNIKQCKTVFSENITRYNSEQKYIWDFIQRKNKIGVWIDKSELISRKKQLMISSLDWKQIYQEKCRFMRRLIRIGQIPYIIQYNMGREIAYLLLQEFQIFKTIKKYLIEVLSYIDDAILVDIIGMGNLKFIIKVLSIKYGTKPRLTFTGKDGLISYRKFNLGYVSYFPIIIHFLEVRNDHLLIEGNMTIPSSIKANKYLVIEVNGIKRKQKLERYKINEFGEKCDQDGDKIFKINIPILEEQELRIRFFYVIEGHECIVSNIICMRFAPIAGVLKNQYFYQNGYTLQIKQDSIIYMRAHKVSLQKKEQDYIQELIEFRSPKINQVVDLRREYFLRMKKKKRPIWIFMDRIDKADDNAEAMFKFVQKYKHIESYFLLDKKCTDFKRLQSVGNVIDINSKQHKILFLLADYIISSQTNGIIENPYNEDAEFLRDIYHQPRFIFLQHGVIKDNMSRTLNRYNTNLYGFITSSTYEYHSIVKGPYQYSINKVWLTGLPRFDYLYRNEKKYIIIMPSWRMNLMTQVWDDELKSMVWKVNEGFESTEYVKKYSSLMNNRKILDVCREYGYQICFMPHVLMAPYIDRFIKNEDIIFWDKSKRYVDAFAEGNLLITDYSSVAFDFAYLRKPVLYYQFDKKHFFETHTYKQGYFDYEKHGFGEVCYKENELVDTIIAYLKTDCRLQSKYKNRIENTFPYNDDKCCERIFNAIVKAGEGFRYYDRNTEGVTQIYEK